MPRSPTSREAESGMALGRWAVRVLVVGGLVATLWFAGPRAWRIASARFALDVQDSVVVPLDRLGAVATPPWVDGPVLRAVLEDLEPRLRGEIALMDEDGARAAKARIAESPFVRDVRFERRFPDRFLVDVDLRRPEVEVVSEGRRVAALDGAGVVLPPGPLPLGLPRVGVDGFVPAVPLASFEYGRAVPDPRLAAAAAVAQEWREKITPAIGAGAPRLAHVDPRNVGWNYVADAKTSRIVVGLERVDGAVAWFHNGLAEVDGGPVSADQRAAVLAAVLQEHPGLGAVLRGDLRLRNLWRDYILLEGR
ncbi:MAG: hypothetical protein O3C51_02330 [Planctomycetota bacterium]|nr:hypothetical protein [Planctomycetota bacterium]MDA1222193.1 hypothetical protein [Planctomycetota bacterium]